jgi:Leucine-rich repeat (LRR) protein
MKLALLFFLSSLLGFAQYTAIPDINFENKLIALGIDSGTADGQVLTANINTLTRLNVSNSAIISLAGIQDFIALTHLDCSQNKVSSLDIANNTVLSSLSCYSNKLTNLVLDTNTSLKTLYCDTNQLTSLAISKNTLLTDLDCGYNQLTSLNLTANTALKSISCGGNSLTNLNLITNTALSSLNCASNLITQLNLNTNTALRNLNCSVNKLNQLNLAVNTALVQLDCNTNLLTSLNIKNGNSHLLIQFDATSNPNLSCIQVDDVTYFNTNWTTKKDATASYNTTCSSLGIQETIFDKISLYPNPTQGELHIDNVLLEKATLYDALGKLLKTTKFASPTASNILNMQAFSKGIYYLFLESEGANAVKMIVVE